MILPIVAAGLSLWVTACIDGTLHGQPKTLCNEFQIRSYPSVGLCEKASHKAVDEWLAALAPYQLDLHVIAVRCGPADTSEGGDDI